MPCGLRLIFNYSVVSSPPINYTTHNPIVPTSTRAENILKVMIVVFVHILAGTEPGAVARHV